VSATTVRLLQAACEAVGGEEALARRLGIAESLLRRFLNDRRQLPDALLLKAVDIVLADREPQPRTLGQALTQGVAYE
jgi:hypothetical protein